MQVRRLFVALSVMSLIAAPLVAQAADGDALRAASPLAEREQLAGSGGAILLGFAAALAAIVIIASDDDEESESP